MDGTPWWETPTTNATAAAAAAASAAAIAVASAYALLPSLVTAGGANFLSKKLIQVCGDVAIHKTIHAILAHYTLKRCALQAKLT